MEFNIGNVFKAMVIVFCLIGSVWAATEHVPSFKDLEEVKTIAVNNKKQIEQEKLYNRIYRLEESRDRIIYNEKYRNANTDEFDERLLPEDIKEYYLRILQDLKRLNLKLNKNG